MTARLSGRASTRLQPIAVLHLWTLSSSFASLYPNGFESLSFVQRAIGINAESANRGGEAETIRPAMMDVGPGRTARQGHTSPAMAAILRR